MLKTIRGHQCLNYEIQTSLGLNGTSAPPMQRLQHGLSGSRIHQLCPATAPASAIRAATNKSRIKPEIFTVYKPSTARAYLFRRLNAISLQ
jgi:hypothetical protein